MTPLALTITNAGRAAAVNAANTGLGPIVISQIALGSSTYTPAASQTALAAEIKRIATFGADVVADDLLHVTITDTSTDAYALGEIGLYTDTGVLFAVYSQATPILEKGAQQLVLLSADILLTSVPPGSVTIGNAEFMLPPATTERQGIVELATPAEAIAGTDGERAVTPAGLASCTATISRRGLVELATGAEALAGTDAERAVTPSALKTALLAAFPVGAVYITAGNTSPGTFLGGTWAQIAQGRTLMGVGTLGSDTYAAGATGGAARVTLTTSEMPAHDHGGATGGESAGHSHSGTTGTAGEHGHALQMNPANASSGGCYGGHPQSGFANPGQCGDQASSIRTSGSHTHTFVTGNNNTNHTHAVPAQGGSSAHENRPPYLVVYFWQRTA